MPLTDSTNLILSCKSNFIENIFRALNTILCKKKKTEGFLSHKYTQLSLSSCVGMCVCVGGSFSCV